MMLVCLDNDKIGILWFQFTMTRTWIFVNLYRVDGLTSNWLGDFLVVFPESINKNEKKLQKTDEIKKYNWEFPLVNEWNQNLGLCNLKDCLQKNI